MQDIVEVEGNRFVITASPFLLARALALPGANKRRDGRVTMPLNLISWYLIADAFGKMDVLAESAQIWWSEENRIMRVGRQVNDRTLEIWSQPDLWEWQAQALARVQLGSVALFDDRGMGKTRVVIEAIRASQSAGTRQAVIVTSRKLRNVWVVASGLWWDFQSVVAPSASTWSAAVDQIGSAPITVVTYESLMNEYVHSAICALNPYWLVLEEAHNLKKRHRQNTKIKNGEEIKTDTKSGLVRSLPGQVRIAVSGTPMPNVWHEVWTLLNFVAPDVFTGFWQFVEGIGSVTETFWGGKEIDIDIHRPEIWDAIYDRWIILRDRSETRRTIWDFAPVELGAQEEKAYRQMLDEMRAEKDNGEVLDAQNILAQATRLQQLAGGLGTWETSKDESGRTTSSYRMARPSAKTDQLVFRLEGLNRAVVFTRFRNRAEFVAAEIEKELGHEVMLMVGGISDKRQKEMLDRFLNSSAENIVAVCVYGTISEGVNELVAARDIFILDWLTAKDVAQAVDRLDRPGTQHDSVRATVLYAQGTIDELMIDRSAIRVLPLKEILRTPEAWAYLVNPIDRKYVEE